RRSVHAARELHLSGQQAMEASLDPDFLLPSRGDRLIALGAVLLVSVLTWFVVRWAAWHLKGTRLGLRGLDKLATPMSLVILAIGGHVVIEQVKEPPIVRAGIELLSIVGVLWLAMRLLDIAFETGRR